MLMDPKKLSELIRMKKKKMMEAEPELVDTDAKPDMNPNDIANNEVDARIQATLKSPERIDATETSLAQSPEDALTMGLTSKEKGRMERLRKYMAMMDI